MSLLKNNSRNVFRNAAKNIKNVLKTDKTDTDKISILETVIDRTKFDTFDRYFYEHPSYNVSFDKDRWEVCPHSAKNKKDKQPVNGSKNPWFVYMLEFIEIMSSPVSEQEKVRLLEISTSYFYNDSSREDWVKV